MAIPGKMTNADFRSMLLNAADQSVLQQLYSKKRKKTGDVQHSQKEENEKKERRKQRYIELQKRQKEKQAAAEEQQEPKEDDEALANANYRDRAEERRKGKDEFYQQVADELREMRTRSVEESKYLGGDVEHTHLVKGLDYALLSKVRSELGNARRQQPKEKKAAPAQKHSCPLARRIHSRVLLTCHPHHIHFADRLNRLHQTILRGVRFKGNTEAFLPDRTSYNFDTQFDMEAMDTPTVVFKSKEDCVEHKEGLVLLVHGKLLSELSGVLQWHAQNKKRLRHERLARRPGAIPVTSIKQRMEPEEDDIFDRQTVPLSGDSAPGEPQRKGPQAADIIREDDEEMDVADDAADEDSIAVVPSTEFNKKYEEYRKQLTTGGASTAETTTRDSNAPKANQDANSAPTSSKRSEKAASAKRRGNEDKRERDPSYISSSYMECYPGFGTDSAYAAYDSDEEEDRTKMDMGRHKQVGAKRKQDFANEEDWERYQSRKEALPKAAFQYGRKLDDNRATRRKKKH